MENFDQFDLFAMMGIEPEFEEERKSKKSEDKKSNKTDSSKVKSKGTKKEPVKAVTFKVPVTVYTGYREPMVFDKTVFNKDTVEADVLLKEVVKLAPEYDLGKAVILQKDSKDESKAYLGYKESSIIRKGNVKLNPKSVMSLAGMTFDLSAIMTDEECDVDIKDISKHLQTNLQVINSFAVVKADDKLVPIFNMPIVKANNIPFPVRVFVFGRDKFAVTEKEYNDFRLDRNDVIDEDDITFDPEVFTQLIVEKFPDFGDGHLQLQYNDKVNIIVPVMKMKSEATSIQTKNKLYPTVDSTISLVWTKYELSPELFGGKEEVTEKEIIGFLAERHPEYQLNTTVLIYDEERKLIKPAYKGSSKGAGIRKIYSDSEELQKLCDIETSGYQLFEYVHEGKQENRVFRIESTPCSLTIAPTDNREGGRFEYRFRKIPTFIYECMNAIFAKAAAVYGTEFMLRIWYDTEVEDYFIEVPKQTVGVGYVNAEFSEELQANASLIPIAEFHSHNIYNAFFSETDNRDEKRNMIYGVFGPYGDGKETNFLMRAGSGGYYVMIEKEEFFDDLIPIVEEEVEYFSSILIEQAEEKITIQ